jgi:hypothetical protein
MAPGLSGAIFGFQGIEGGNNLLTIGPDFYMPTLCQAALVYYDFKPWANLRKGGQFYPPCQTLQSAVQVVSHIFN